MTELSCLKCTYLGELRSWACWHSPVPKVISFWTLENLKNELQRQQETGWGWGLERSLLQGYKWEEESRQEQVPEDRVSQAASLGYFIRLMVESGEWLGSAQPRDSPLECPGAPSFQS